MVEQVLEAIAPGGIEAALQASEVSAVADQEKRNALELALERAGYEAQRSKRQYDLVDPENRLVASELEARWNSALEEAAVALGVSHTVVKTLIRKGILPARQVVAFAPWVIESKDVESPTVRAAARGAKRGQRFPSTVVGQHKLTL